MGSVAAVAECVGGIVLKPITRLRGQLTDADAAGWWW